RLRTLTTRLSAVREQRAHVPDDLSTLRRSYSEVCSRDLNDVPTNAGERVERARRALRDAERASIVNEWERVAESLRDTTEHLDAADTGMRAVRQRVEELRDVAADPAKTLDSVR